MVYILLSGKKKKTLAKISGLYTNSLRIVKASIPPPLPKKKGSLLHCYVTLNN